jgi:beta-lactamase superfamily II metal-dependent hydrolase
MRNLAVLFAIVLIGCSARARPGPKGPAPTAPKAATTASSDFTVHVVDVGTGLGVFVQGEDFALVYDAGSNDDAAVGDRNRFLAYLRVVAPDLQKIDHVILSHPHRDHVELLPDLIASYAVENVWDSGAINPICGYRRFIQAIVDSPSARYHSGANDEGRRVLDFQEENCLNPKLPAKVLVRHAARMTEGTPITIGAKATMTFLHVDAARHGDRFNENSVVMLFDLDGAKVLFMGDAEGGGREDPSKPPTPKSVEGYVLAKYRTSLHADVLVAGHHGSKSSSRKALVDAVAPKVSVISAGPTKYQSVVLPDAEIVSELEQVGQVFRTDIDDEACAKNPSKIGPDADGKPGGCDNIRIRIRAGGIKAGYVRLSD